MSIKLNHCYTFICSRFIYWGRVKVISDDGYWLSDAFIIYETGPWKDPKWQSYERLPNGWHIPKIAVECIGIGKSHLLGLIEESPAESAGVTVLKPEQESTHTK